MDSKTEAMVALGTAIGANCIPCFDFLYSKAREVNLDESEIKQIAVIAFKVKTGASTFMSNAVSEVVGGESETGLPCTDKETCSCG